ncbi:hypothetical protein AN57_02918 [Mycobacterium tuberculosis M1212]|nr:hypothetical protein AN57_02918 [Mycobacterium tuberculosis M1212]
MPSPFLSRQTQNPERGRKLLLSNAIIRRRSSASSDPKPREGTETFRRQFVDHEFSESSDPKPREGTETLGIPCADSGFACRQTQNPERGRKPGEQRRRQPGGHGSVVRPKTPRGDGNQVSNGGGNLAATGRSSDPKPREGTETSSTIIAIPSPHVSSDPKPREGTETFARVPVSVVNRQSSDPKPREGTETLNNAQ